MATAKTVLSEAVASMPPAIRISHIWGHGEWHHEADRAVLQSWVDAGNEKHGAGSHWIEAEGKE